MSEPIFGTWKPWINDEKSFLFHVKSFFVLKIFKLCLDKKCSKRSLIIKIRLTWKFMTSQTQKIKIDKSKYAYGQISFKISIWAYNFITSRMIRFMNIIFLTINTMLLFCLIIYSTLLTKIHHQTKITEMLKVISCK